jgi:hypothetical protein
MKELMNSAVKYLFDTLAVKIKPEKWDQSALLPRFLLDMYDFHTIGIGNQPYLLAAYQGETEITPAAIAKHLALARQKWNGPAVYLSHAVTAYNRKRLIERKVPFIVPGRQIYLPEAGLALTERFKKMRGPVNVFSPAAQAVVIHALLRDEYGPATQILLSKKLKYSTMTLSRVFDEIAATGLGLAGPRGRERVLTFSAVKRALWEKALPNMRSPVRKRIWIFEAKRDACWPVSGLSALAERTMLSAPQEPVYAVSGALWKTACRRRKIEVLPLAEPGAACIELWRYPPDLFAANGQVDPLSLYLILSDDPDERVAAEAERMLEGMPW